jgi:hypothetical protein
MKLQIFGCLSYIYGGKKMEKMKNFIISMFFRETQTFSLSSISSSRSVDGRGFAVV